MTLFGIKFAASAKQYVSRFSTEHPVDHAVPFDALMLEGRVGR